MKNEAIYVHRLVPLLFIGLGALMALIGALLYTRGADDGFGMALMISGAIIALVTSPIFLLRVAAFEEDFVYLGSQKFAYADIRMATGDTQRVSDLGAVALKRRSRWQDYIYLHLNDDTDPTVVAVAVSAKGPDGLADMIMERVRAHQAGPA